MPLPDLIEAHRADVGFGQRPPHLSTAASSYCHRWNRTGGPERASCDCEVLLLLLLLDAVLSGACSIISLSRSPAPPRGGGRGGARGGATELLLEPVTGRQRRSHHAGGRVRRRGPQLLVVVTAPHAHDVAVVVHAAPPRELHARKHGLLGWVSLPSPLLETIPAAGYGVWDWERPGKTSSRLW